jgi:hypothetical protein
MDLQERLKLAQEAGPEYSELAFFFEAASTTDVDKLTEFQSNSSAAVRFASFVNPITHVSSADLSIDPIIKFAAIHNPATSREILDLIGLNQTAVNPVIPEVIHMHKNASEEFQVFRAITDFGISEDWYEDAASELYFRECIYDEDNKVHANIDLVTLEALMYIYLLGEVGAPSDTGEFWDYLFDSEPKNLKENLALFGRMVAIPESLYDECSTIAGVRSLAGAWTKDISLMKSLMWDKQTLYTGIGGFYWQDSRSPRSSVASNSLATPEMLRQLFQEESNDEEGLGAFPHPVLWRLSCNASTPQDVLEGIVELIESEKVRDEYAQLELLVGEPDDFPYGLITSVAVQGDLRKRVEKLVRDRDLDPDDYEVFKE